MNSYDLNELMVPIGFSLGRSRMPQGWQEPGGGGRGEGEWIEQKRKQEEKELMGIDNSVVMGSGYVEESTWRINGDRRK